MLAKLILILSSLCLLYLAYTDLVHRQLPNKWVAAYGLLFFCLALIIPIPISKIGIHILIGLLAFIVLVLLFIIGAMGGGDVKLGAALFLWGGSLWLGLAFVAACVGAVIGTIGWLLDRQMFASFSMLQTTRHILSAKRGVPYGVGLAVSGLLTNYIYWLNVG